MCRCNGSSRRRSPAAGRWPVLGLTLVLAAGPGQAGPLDREPAQQRYNPAAETMLRVPGVVGLYEAEALAVLQQAGLGVRLERITADDPRYRNREGRVVRQVPDTGGVAMVGATVVITVYKAAPETREETVAPWDEDYGGGCISPEPEGMEYGDDAEP